MKRLVIIADDFGFGPEVNQGIIKLWKKGFIGGASLGTNFPFFSQACQLSKENKVEIGCHINLTQGKPILSASRLKSLVNSQGDFLGKEELLIKTLVGKINLKEVEQEIGAQIKKIKSFGFKPSFANGHQSVHLFPGIFPVFLAEIKRAKIPFIRHPLDVGLKDWHSFFVRPHRKILLFLFGQIACRKLELAKISFPDHSLSLTLKKPFKADDLFIFLKKLKGKIIELSAHPGFLIRRPINQFKTYLIKQREKELNFLLSRDFQHELKRSGHQLARFSQFL